MDDNEHSHWGNRSDVTNNGTNDYGWPEQVEVGRRQAREGIGTALQQPGESYAAWTYRQQGMDE